MSGIFQKLFDIGVKLGNITDAHMYDGEFINIEGMTYEGKKFTISLHIKEEKEND